MRRYVSLDDAGLAALGLRVPAPEPSARPYSANSTLREVRSSCCAGALVVSIVTAAARQEARHSIA
jgi:hypothetical protein